MKTVTVYTDGACEGNPGPGGWAAVILDNGEEKRLKGAEKETTNNRMEIMAVLMALKSLDEPCEVHIFSDSKYVINSCSKWLSGWEKNGFTSSTGEPVKNTDLWKEMSCELQKHTAVFTWVKGHAGYKYNEICDKLAVQAIAEITGKAYNGRGDEKYSKEDKNTLLLKKSLAAMQGLLENLQFELEGEETPCGAFSYCRLCIKDFVFPCALAYTKEYEGEA